MLYLNLRFVSINTVGVVYLIISCLNPGTCTTPGLRFTSPPYLIPSQNITRGNFTRKKNINKCLYRNIVLFLSSLAPKFGPWLMQPLKMVTFLPSHQFLFSSFIDIDHKKVNINVNTTFPIIQGFEVYKALISHHCNHDQMHIVHTILNFLINNNV